MKTFRAHIYPLSLGCKDTVQLPIFYKDWDNNIGSQFESILKRSLLGTIDVKVALHDKSLFNGSISALLKLREKIDGSSRIDICSGIKETERFAMASKSNEKIYICGHTLLTPDQPGLNLNSRGLWCVSRFLFLFNFKYKLNIISKNNLWAKEFLDFENAKITDEELINYKFLSDNISIRKITPHADKDIYYICSSDKSLYLLMIINTVSDNNSEKPVLIFNVVGNGEVVPETLRLKYIFSKK